MTAADGMIGNYVAYDSGQARRTSSSARPTPPASRRCSPGRSCPACEGTDRAESRQPDPGGHAARGRLRQRGNSQAGVGAADTLRVRRRPGIGVQHCWRAGIPGLRRRRLRAHGDRPGGQQQLGPGRHDPRRCHGTDGPPGQDPLINGTGPAVTKGEDLAVQYTGVNWRTGKVFDSSWARNAPLTAVIGEGQVIKGWDLGLAGQTVGSRVLLVDPRADGYGKSGASSAGIRAPTSSSSWSTSWPLPRPVTFTCSTVNIARRMSSATPNLRPAFRPSSPAGRPRLRRPAVCTPVGSTRPCRCRDS